MVPPARPLPEVALREDAVRHVRAGHPWVFRGSVARAEGAGLCRLVDARRAPVGLGVHDADSPLAVRVWSADPDAHDFGAILDARLARAFAVRRALFADGRTTAYRALNGEGDRTPGFVVDRYGDIAVLRTDGDAAARLAETYEAHLVRALRAEGVTAVLARDGSRGEAKTRPLVGDAPDVVTVEEHGVPMRVDLARGQKTGAFLDQRENRRRVGEATRALRVVRGGGAPLRALNLFSYTGGFSLHAALAGATVTSVDVAMRAHATAQESFRLAGLDPRAHGFVTADAFAWVEAAAARGERFDVVVCDPPSLAPNERAKANALAAYRKLHHGVARLVAEGGVLFAASCSSHVGAEDFLGTLDDRALGRDDLRLVAFFGPPEDHPTLPAFREGRYLKMAVLR